MNRLTLTVGAALLLALGLAVLSNTSLRSTNAALSAKLDAANARVALMQSEVAACREQIERANAQVLQYQAAAEAASGKAEEVARAELSAPRQIPKGHGPAAMNAWLGTLR